MNVKFSSVKVVTTKSTNIKPPQIIMIPQYKRTGLLPARSSRGARRICRRCPSRSCPSRSTRIPPCVSPPQGTQSLLSYNRLRLLICTYTIPSQNVHILYKQCLRIRLKKREPSKNWVRKVLHIGPIEKWKIKRKMSLICLLK